MDLRKDFEGILRDLGHNILLVRQDAKLRCSCWNEKNQESSRECPVCFGLGVVPVIEKHTIRDTVLTVTESLARVNSDAPFGEMGVPSRIYYFNHNARVRTQDLIVEVEWSPSGKPIYQGGPVWEVGYVDELRFFDGEIVYKKVAVRDTPIEKAIRGVRIANSKGIKNYEIVRGHGQ